MEIVYSSASHHAMLFAYVAKETIDTFGEDGRQAILRAVDRYGMQRGRRMAMRAKLDGVPVNGLSYSLYSEWGCFPGQVECSACCGEGSYRVKYHRCPWYTEWKHYDMLRYGRCYCGRVDAAILKGFGISDGALEGSRVDGCHTCDLVFLNEGYDREAYERYLAQKRLLGDQAQMPWQYHLGHLYQALRNEILHRFGRDGRKILKRALKSYELQFGKAAKDLVLEYGELDFDALPPYRAPLQNRDDTTRIRRVITTEVLVAGGSGAAVMAAVEASRRGLQVTLLSKGKVGRSGNLIMAGGGFGVDGWSAKHELGMEDACDAFTKADMLDCLIKEGFYLSDQDLARLYVEEGPAATGQFLGWAEKCGQKYAFMPNGTWIGSGRSFARALEQGMRENPEIRRLEDCVLMDVIRDEKRVTGALALDVYRGELLLIECKSVILATGGYQPFEVNNTSSDMTGDGQAIACRAGAKLVDMEFILGMTTALQPEEMRGSIYPFVFEFNMPQLQYRLLDRNMRPIEIPEEVLRRFRGKKISKLVNSYYFAQAQAKGLLTDRGGLYLDYSANSPEQKRRSLEEFYDRFGAWYQRGYYNGESLEPVAEAIMNDEPLEVTLGFEYSLGGIQVDSDMQTGVPGLFAAGEVTSGTFGACRAGDGILEMLVQGRRAGQSAAAYCRRVEHRAVDGAALEQKLQHHSRYFREKGGISPHQIFDGIQSACTEGFGLIRDEAGLTGTLERLEELQIQLDTLCGIRTGGTAYNMEWLRAMQCENLLTCCKAGVRAALERRESRGCHMRRDYPEVDHDNSLVKYVFSSENGVMVMSRRSPRVESYALPEGRKASVMDYLTDPELRYRR